MEPGQSAQTTFTGTPRSENLGTSSSEIKAAFQRQAPRPSQALGGREEWRETLPSLFNREGN